MTHRLMSNTGISEHIELLCFHAKEWEKRKTRKIYKYMRTVQPAPKKGNHIPIKLQYYKSKKILAKFIKLYWVNPSQAHAKVFS